MASSTVPALAIHGGCGVAAPEEWTAAEWAEARAALATALRAGWAVLSEGGSAVDAVAAAVIVLEDAPSFNAGHGAALTEDAIHELEASVMDGSGLRVGAVAGVRRVRNPVLAARSVMEDGRVVALAGEAADHFADALGLEMVENEYFTTARRKGAFAHLKALSEAGRLSAATEADRHGTVGAVARDARGGLSAATSTGGFNDKPSGRIGDTPIPGAGVWARNGCCAVSCTGKGKAFLRHAAAHEVDARVRLGGETLDQAVHHVVNDAKVKEGAGAGVVAIGVKGEPILVHNTLGMFRGHVATDGRLHIGIHSDVFEYTR